jgi:hypothetical protein
MSKAKRTDKEMTCHVYGHKLVFKNTIPENRKTKCVRCKKEFKIV